MREGDALLSDRERMQSEIERLGMENADLRFDRDRFSKSTATFQAKLTQCLTELDDARKYREEALQLRLDIIDMAREFSSKLEQQLAASSKREQKRAESLVADKFKKRLQQEVSLADARHEGRLKAAIADLEARYEDRLSAEIVSLAREFAVKLKRPVGDHDGV